MVYFTYISAEKRKQFMVGSQSASQLLLYCQSIGNFAHKSFMHQEQGMYQRNIWTYFHSSIIFIGLTETGQMPGMDDGWGAGVGVPWRREWGLVFPSWLMHFPICVSVNGFELYPQLSCTLLELFFFPWVFISLKLCLVVDKCTERIILKI